MSERGCWHASNYSNHVTQASCARRAHKSRAPCAFCWTAGFNKDDCGTVVQWSTPLVVLALWQEGHGFHSSLGGPFCAEFAWAPSDREGSFRVLLQSKNICVGLICKSELSVRVNVSMRGCKWTLNELQGVTPINRECTNHTGQPHPHRSGQSH